MDAFFLFVSVGMFLLTLYASGLLLSSTETFGDPLGGLEGPNPSFHSKVHALSGLLLLLFAVGILVGLPALSEREVLEKGEYTYTKKLEKTIIEAPFDTLETDNVIWANLIESPNKICVLEVKHYNLLGGELGSASLSIDRPPCEPRGKYEF